MTDDADISAIRREPPPFRRVTVGRIDDLSPYLRRFTLVGPELEGLEIDEPAASVRVLFPSSGSDQLVVPEWTGNEFLMPSGERPLIRTFTPRYLRSDPAELDLDVVLHGGDGASGWAHTAGVGDDVAVSGPGRGYQIDPSGRLILLGDETAIPAIAQLLEQTPAAVEVAVHVEVARPDARVELPEHPGATISWYHAGPRIGDTLVDALRETTIDADTRVWAAGEAAAMQRLRKHLQDRDVDRSQTTVRGYWKEGRAGPG